VSPFGSFATGGSGGVAVLSGVAVTTTVSGGEVTVTVTTRGAQAENNRVKTANTNKGPRHDIISASVVRISPPHKRRN
jgi:hypothetical protein